ncbi:hypothetical protein PF005_g29376 [Phytophthora fragariae]|uniref:Uncharacterized protein n=1 Tax=Phytophthora fragariae TaxID=53985 RepID=A0A6A3TKP8_9STRA|nr:hypothetical protein PF009_g30631 [Phytophthora fragariae]KAE8962011.1 hypothetical protein PF011_g29542 [Phytophthora fragariae]KAE9071737.1 hypothetical protein PF006_g29087 [Phytophthora fragariae]KAE9137513.1 hypothetical protein PF007_g1736 [Phytophthora fragariae]KAE9166007.1 hypothetical protein PF005_g29376 [Phytophthora fragariae]
MESRDQEDSVSEAFFSDTSGDPRATTSPNLGTATGAQTTRAGLAGLGAPGTNPVQTDLTIPDLSTPEGLATTRMVLQRVVDGTSRTGQGVGLSWASLGQGQGASAVNAQGTPVNQTTMGAYYSRATSVASSSVPQAAGGANPVTPSPTVTNPMFGGAYLGLTSTAGPTPMAYSTLVPPGTARSAFPTYGGYSLSGLPITNLPGLTNATPMGATPSMGFGPSITPVGLSAGTPQVGSTYVQASVNAGGSATQASTATTTVTAYGGMPSRIKNAVKMIQPFYSDESTVEKARAFWNAFERATVGLEEQLRLSAFRGCLKGKTAEDWWMYSIIPDFETLRTRFHN